MNHRIASALTPITITYGPLNLLLPGRIDVTSDDAGVQVFLDLSENLRELAPDDRQVAGRTMISGELKELKCLVLHEEIIVEQLVRHAMFTQQKPRPWYLSILLDRVYRTQGRPRLVNSGLFEIAVTEPISS